VEGGAVHEEEHKFPIIVWPLGVKSLMFMN
jgi:hypothetical protein